MIRSIADYRVGICPFKVNKCDAVTETKHGNFCKNLVCPNFSRCPKNLSCAKFGRAGGGGCCSPPSPDGTYAYGCYHLFFQLNNGNDYGVDPITWVPKQSKGQMNIISQTISNFFLLLHMSRLIRRGRFCGQGFTA